MEQEKQALGIQNTGNPVLDSTVNLIMSYGGRAKIDDFKKIHSVVLALAEQEPGGLKRQKELVDVKVRAKTMAS